MAHYLEFARWGARFRAVLALAIASVFAACDASDKLTEVSEEPTILSADPVDVPASFSTSFRGGIPMGTSSQPTGAFGSLYNGALRIIWPEYLRRELADIRSRGGKVVLNLAGGERNYKDAYGRFDLGKWKARVNRYRNVSFSDFVQDGTIVGHYLIDEPYDPENWNKPVPGSTLEEMARYSKQLWPSMVTIVRAEPYLIKWTGTYRYLDAAWAQYLYRKGNVYDYIRRNVSEAQRMGLGLVVGLNLVDGGTPSGTWMSADEVKNWGSALLSSSYPCAFVSWQYNSNYLSCSSIKTAMSVLKSKAENRATKSCRGP